ncbi:TPA: hypothetical protein CPT91_04750 [Candidatus Gastranaerophilales bacterium HUM_16]|nr:MAG TPA: hypothetical protein CPT91_04750 [Candidatus Gastranaerophilales bacterium HUM_16]
MLNRIKKNLILAFAGMLLALPVFALDSTVSYINVNNRAYQDVEIAITDKSEILLPFKQLADLFNIPYTANRVDKHISFKTWDGKEGMITQQGVFVQDAPVSKRKTEFLQQGIMDGVFNEAYITADAASKIFGAKFETNYEDLTLSAQVDRDIPLLHTNNAVAEDKGPKAYQDVVAPKKAGKITLNTIGLRSNLLSDSLTVKGQGYRTLNDTFSGSTQASINGNIYGGKYRIEATEYHYRSDAFMFGGITGAYKNSIKDKETGKEKLWYELGKVKGRTDVDASIGTNIFGAQIWNYDYEKERPEKINGYVKPTSLVRLTVNDLEPVTLSTYAGYYTLKDVQLPNPVKSIKLEEVNEDGSVEIIREERYSIYGDKPFEKEHRGSAYAGVWGYQNRFFREGGNIYRGNNKKVTAGIDYQYGIKDNITFESRVTGDKLYEKNGTSIVYRVPTNDTLLVSGTQKSVNYLEGATALNSVEWVNPKNKNIKGRLTAGASVAHDIREEHTHAGYIVKAAGEYEKDLEKYQRGIFKPKRAAGRLELFQTSPDFYIASSDSTSKNDRTGGKVSGNISFNSTNAGGSYSRYYSNMNHRYRGGTIKFDEASINASTKIPKVANLRFNSYYRRGENELGRNKNYFYDANASRDIARWARVQAGRRESLYDTEYDTPNSLDRNYHSKYTDNYAQLDVPIPGNHGRFTLGHNIVRYNTATYKNGYNMFRFGYTFPTWKRLTLGLGYGFRYSGQGGNDFNVNIGYRAKSGQTMSVGYQYSENGGYFIDNMFTPTTNRHSINFVFNDAFQIFHNGLKSVGDEDLNKGLFEAIAFVDVNKNGKYDKKIDVPIQNVPLITSWTGETSVTNKRGRVYSSSLEQGIYTVSIDMNQLPITVAPFTNDLINKKVKIDGGQTTQLEIPLISTVGSVSGTLKIFDDFQRDLKITDFVVVILDENGEEVNYSTVDSTGVFYISGLAPGNYTLKLDEKFIDAYGLEMLPEKSEISISIPYDYKTPVDFTEQNLEYKTLAL